MWEETLRFMFLKNRLLNFAFFSLWQLSPECRHPHWQLKFRRPLTSDERY